MNVLIEAGATLDARTATLTSLFNCLIREVAPPLVRDGHLEVRLARLDVRLRASLTRPPLRYAPPVEERHDTSWQEIGWERLADLVAGELELATGHPNPEFLRQVRASHLALECILAQRVTASGSDYLESEQSLVTGHRFHPAPKARQGNVSEWAAYAPELRARFPLRWLAVPEELTAEEGDTTLVDAIAPPVPAGFRALPVHPWQYGLLRLPTERILDLGETGPVAFATSSVRTVYLPEHDFFCKFSLDVRITNCVRKNAWYELSGAVALTRLLRPVFAELAESFDGCRLLGEPGYRTADLDDLRLYEGLGVIVREGVADTRGTPILAGALADPWGCPILGHDATREQALAWWDRYVGLVVPPVLHAYLRHGVVLEPHLQNVLVVLDATGWPQRAVFRDLEGTKLLPSHWPRTLHDSTYYDAERGWNRVVYCLLVNHLAEVAAALADRYQDLEEDLWSAVRKQIIGYAARHIPQGSARLDSLLNGRTLPAKANLRTRWARAADRAATYVRVPNPLRGLP